MYWTTYGPAMSELDTGAFIDLELTNGGVARFTRVESLDFDILNSVSGDPFGIRWGTNFGPGTIAADGQSAGISAFTIAFGEGIQNQFGPTSTSRLDQGYDPDANAFLFAEIELEGLGGGNTQILISAGAGGIVHNGGTATPVYGAFGIFGCFLTQVRGDINNDGAVNLLDVSGFVNMFVTGEFVCNGDINVDGIIDLNDVDPFINLLLQQ